MHLGVFGIQIYVMLKFGTVLLTCCKTVYFDNYVRFIDILVNLVGKARLLVNVAGKALAYE